jgi:hypothetical protein
MRVLLLSLTLINGVPIDQTMRLDFRAGKVTITQLPIPQRPRAISEVRSFKLRGRRIILSAPPPRPDMMIHDPILEMRLEDDGAVVIGSVRFVRKQ